MANKLEIIALSGRAGSGKDYIFNHHLAPLGYYRWALADHFKIWIVGKKLATYEEVFKTKPEHTRRLLQQAGTEEGRNVYGVDVWLDTAYTWMNHLSQTMNINKFCLTDVRFPNEAEYIKSRGGKVFRILAPERIKNSSLSEEARKHISETALDDYNKFDGIIYNDPKYSETVKSQLYNLLDISITGEFPAWEGFDEAFNTVDDAFDKMDDAFKLINKAFKNNKTFKAFKWGYWKKEK